MSKIKTTGLAIVAVCALSALVATSAFALPEFKSTANTTYTGTNLTTPTLKAKQLGVEGTISCEKAAAKGEIINNSMETKKNVVEFTGKCEQTIGSSKSTCTEPITTKELTGTLGYIKKEAKPPVGLLLKPTVGKIFAEPVCGGSKTNVEGEIVGEFTAASLNKSQTKFQLNFAATGVSQSVKTFLLLPEVFMENVHLQVEGFFGGEASQSVNEELTSAIAGEIKA
jgi:hypothetical protein